MGLSSVPAAAQKAVAASGVTSKQAPAPAGTASASDAGNDTAIVITAQKRSENVQKVPISVAAFSGQTLAKSNVTDISQLGKIASNYQATKSVQSSFMRVNIRGIGAIGNTTIEPSVAIFVDGAYVPRAGAVVSSLLDIESVEVLRGPQGTLFGRNASVGALSLHSAQPRFDELSARVTGEVGTGDRYKVDGFLNLPIGKQAALRVAGLHQSFQGYWHNKLDGKTYGGTTDDVFRGSFRAQAGAFDWVLRADYSHVAGDGIPDIELDKDSINADPQLKRIQTLLAGGPDTNFNDRNFNQYVTADLRDKQWGLNSTLSWDVGGGSTLRLINSYRDWKNRQLDGDVVFSPAPVISRSGNFASKSQNHELQFISPQEIWLDGRLDMVAGLYYFGEKYRLGENFHMNSQYCNVAFYPRETPFTVVKPACNNYVTANGGFVENATDQDVTQKVDSFAGYAQGNFHFNDQIFATLGGRYTKDKKQGTYDQTVSNMFIGAGIFRAPEALTLPKINDSRFTYRLGLNYEPTKDLLFYGSYSTGYKSGGYNSGGGSSSLTTVAGVFHPERRVFDRETVQDWELGAKTSWLDRQLTLNLNFYRMDISGYQDRAFDGISFNVLNAGKLRQQGFEFDAVAKPLRGLSLFASVAYLDSAFLDYPNAPGLPGCAANAAGLSPAACTAVGLSSTQDLKGKPAANSPKWSGRLGFDWTGNLGSTGWTWDATSNLSFFSKQYEGIITDANPQTIEPSYAVLGGRLSLSSADRQWTASLFGNNLLNKQYGLANLYQPLDSSMLLRNGIFPGSTAVRRQHADPRTVGASLTFRY